MLKYWQQISPHEMYIAEGERRPLRRIRTFTNTAEMKEEISANWIELSFGLDLREQCNVSCTDGGVFSLIIQRGNKKKVALPICLCQLF